jgi:hypothetical protein
MKQQNKSKSILFSCLGAALLAVVLVSCSTPHALGDGGGGATQQAYFAFNPEGPTMTNCVGQYYGCFKMTNATGGTWLVPPTNVTAGIFSNLTGLGSNINWSMSVAEKPLLVNSWCTNNSPSLTFPASYLTPFGSHNLTNSFSLYLYVNTLTNSSITLNNPITLQITWVTNSAN